MANPPDDLAAQLQALRDDYLARLPAKISHIQQQWAELAGGAWDHQIVETLHRDVHTLIGSSGTYGFSDVAERARALEIALRGLLETGTHPPESIRREIERLMSALQEIPLSPSAASAAPGKWMTPDQPPHARGANRLVFLALHDVPLPAELATQIGYFGYSVQTFDRGDALRQAAEAARPAVIIVDSAFAESELARAARQTDMPAIPLLFISDRGDLPARLAAVRAGAEGYFTKPIDLNQLISRLDSLIAPQLPEPFRVLIVDDAPEIADILERQLQQAGMVTARATDPLQVMQPLTEFHPDLILMDIYMPGCTGLELARVIRQQEDYVSIPIVYLSTENNPDRQLEALRLGGDDFLMKPIEANHLISVVIARSQRSRILRAFIMQDGLTGLLNHTATKERLDIELARARRQNSLLAFAMIDLDHFKQVNDTFGHSTGDQVLKSLAQLFRQRLRKTDTIGRFGGEEFAVILPEARAENAVHVMEEIRTGFAKIHQQSAQGEFSVTFSCGIATYPEHADGRALVDAADRALYQAKSRGRNRVCLASEEWVGKSV